MEIIALIASIAGTAVLRHYRQKYDIEEQEVARAKAAKDSNKAFCEYMNPKLQSQGRLDRCIKIAPFLSIQEARENIGQPKRSQSVWSLNGIWKFKLFESVQSAVSQVSKKEGIESQDLVNIRVPGSWQLQVPGDAPIYTNFKYIIPVDPPNVPDLNPTGYYTRTFSLPASTQRSNKSHVNLPLLESHRIYLSFGGVDSFFHLWVNHQYVGFSKDSRLAADFNVTKYLSTSASGNINVLVEVVVARYSDGHYLEDQDMFNLSGIFRDVLVYMVRNEVAIVEYEYETLYNEATNEAVVEVSVWVKERIMPIVRNKQGSISPYKFAFSASLQEEGLLESSVYYSVDDPSPERREYEQNNPPRPRLRFSSKKPTASILKPIKSPSPGDDLHVPEGVVKEYTEEGYVVHKETALLKVPAKSCHLWSAENPYLYTLTVSLLDLQDMQAPNTSENGGKKANFLQCESCRVGIRTIRITSEGILTVNNRPVTVRGVNLHEHDPMFGHTVTPQLLEADILIMKRHNFNAVRTSHYPQQPWFYELCTVYGMYVIDECNIETHGMKPYVGRLADDPDWEAAHMLRMTRLYYRDRLHTCVIGWSLGNEAGYGAVHDRMAAWLRAQDRTRIVMYEPASYGPRGHNHLLTGVDAPPTLHSGAMKPLWEKGPEVEKVGNSESSWTNVFGLFDSAPFPDEQNLSDNDLSEKMCVPQGPSVATDVVCPMYARVDECIQLSTLYPSMPLIQCEYAHMMGNSGGGLSQYWDLFYNKKDHPRIQGGFIWDWADQGITITDATGRPKWAYGGDFGENSHDSNFCINGLVWPDRGLDLPSLYYDRALPYVGGLVDANTYTKYGEAVTQSVLTENLPRLLGLQCAQVCPRLDKRRGASFDVNTASSSLSDGLNTLPGRTGRRRKARVSFSLEPNNNPVLRAVQSLVAKPALLEAKQCMRPFHVVVRSVTHEGGEYDDDSSGFGSTGFSSPSQTPLVTPLNTPAHTPAHTPKSAAQMQRKPSTAKISRSHSKRSFRTKKTTGIHYLLNLDEGPRIGVPVHTTLAARRISGDAKDYFFDSPVGSSKEDLAAAADFAYVSDEEDEDDDEDFGNMPFDDSTGRLIVNVNFAVENRFDHTEDVFSKLDFEAFLLCDGLIVAVERIAPFLFMKPNTHRSVDMSSKFVSFSGATCKQKGDVEFDLNWMNVRAEAPQCRDLFHEKNFCGAGLASCLHSDVKNDKKCIPFSYRVPIMPGLQWSPTMFTSVMDIEGMRTQLRDLHDHCSAHLHGTPSGDQTETLSPSSAKSPTSTKAPLWTRLRTSAAPEEVSLEALRQLYPFDTNSLDVSTQQAAMGNRWSVVVHSRTAAPCVWAEEGYPMGFQQIDISAQCAALLDPALRPRLSRPPSTYQTANLLPEDSVPISSEIALSAPLLESRSTSSEIFSSSKRFGAKFVQDEYTEVAPSIELVAGDMVVAISGDTGMVTSLRKDGFEYLYSGHSPEPVAACRLQLHRAPTDNDRNGYLAIWAAMGLDQALVMAPLLEPEAGLEPCQGDLSEGGTYNTPYVQVARLAASAEGRNTIQLQCKWSMRSAVAANHMQLHVLRSFTDFLNDSSCKQILLRFDSPEEEAFIHLLGMEYRLGRRTCVHGDGDHSAVHVWKAWLYINATIPSAEALIGGGFGSTDVSSELGTSLDGVDVRPSFQQELSLNNSGLIDELRVNFSANYILSAEGHFTMQVMVDAVCMPAPLPRVGLQINLPLRLQHLRWYGVGPHECYPDRQSSGASAIHGADLLEETLHVPYVRPGENGSRAGVKWAQFCSNEISFRSEITASDRSYMDAGDCSSMPQTRWLKVQSNRDFHLSVQRFSTEDLTAATHINDVAAHPRPYFAVNLDPFLMGVGGDDSWSACVHDKDLLQQHLNSNQRHGESQVYTYELSFSLC